ncbi:MAG TPA: hypothetical protein VHI93_08120, partial [Candidatus Thermoplasmatota archaeon]|nr:hypothetical protein [Candidatus Thermoplasmatota archaeon]
MRPTLVPGPRLQGTAIVVPAGEVWMASGDLTMKATVAIDVHGFLVTLPVAGSDGGSIALEAPSVHVHAGGGIATASGAGHALSGGSIGFSAPSVELDAGACIGTGHGAAGRSVDLACVPDALEVPPVDPLMAGAGGHGGSVSFPGTSTAGLNAQFALGNGGDGGDLVLDTARPVSVPSAAGAGGSSGLILLAGAIAKDPHFASLLPLGFGNGGDGGAALLARACAAPAPNVNGAPACPAPAAPGAPGALLLGGSPGGDGRSGLRSTHAGGSGGRGMRDGGDGG